MAYEQGGCDPRFATKKALREAIKEGREVYLYSTSAFGGWSGSAKELPEGTTFTVVGPDPERRRSWYASVTRKGGAIKVA